MTTVAIDPYYILSNDDIKLYYQNRPIGKDEDFSYNVHVAGRTTRKVLTFDKSLFAVRTKV